MEEEVEGEEEEEERKGKGLDRGQEAQKIFFHC